jgi:site-specific recombinase XerD
LRWIPSRAAAAAWLPRADRYASIAAPARPCARRAPKGAELVERLRRGQIARQEVHQEARALPETDLDARHRSILIKHGTNDKRREVGMDAWAWSALAPWIADRTGLPVGPLFCVIDGPTHGRALSAARSRSSWAGSHATPRARRRFAPHQLRHADAVELLHEGIPLPLIQRQPGLSYLSTTATYLQGIDSEEVISAVHPRRAPMMHASAGLEL